MRKFAESWPNRELVQRTVALIPWRSNLTLLEKLKEAELERKLIDHLENSFWNLGRDLLSIEEIEKELEQGEIEYN